VLKPSPVDKLALLYLQGAKEGLSIGDEFKRQFVKEERVLKFSPGALLL